jgi:PqqD family protein of HPr-rel-A system
LAASKPRLRDDVTLVEIDREAVVYDPSSRLVHYLNPMASLVLQLCDGTATVKETIGELADAQESTPDEIAPSVQTLMRQFRRLGLVTPSKGADTLRALTEGDHDERETIRREVPRSD